MAPNSDSLNMCLKSRASLVNPELLQARPSSLVLRRRTTCLCSMAARRTLAAGRGHGRGAPNAAAAAAPAAADDDDDDDDDEDDDDEEDGESFRAWPALHPRRLALRTIAVAEPCVGPYVGSGTAAATRTPLECPRLQDASIPLTAAVVPHAYMRFPTLSRLSVFAAAAAAAARSHPQAHLTVLSHVIGEHVCCSQSMSMYIRSASSSSPT